MGIIARLFVPNWPPFQPSDTIGTKIGVRLQVLVEFSDRDRSKNGR